MELYKASKNIIREIQALRILEEKLRTVIYTTIEANQGKYLWIKKIMHNGI